MLGRIRVFIACSLDGFIAGPNDDLSWLPPPGAGEGEDFGYTAFMAEVGSLLMGRRTYDVAAGFEGAWPYGDRPVLVATHNPLTPKVPTVQAIAGPMDTLLAAARAAAGGKDVYLDGGDLIRQALDADCIDQLCISIAPVVLGRGSPLFAGLPRYHRLQLLQTTQYKNGLVQLTYAPLP